MDDVKRRKRCVNYKGEHKANDRICELYRKQEEINRIMAKEGVTGYVARKREDAVRRNSNGSKGRTEERKEEEGYREEDRLEEASGISWADIVTRKGQRQEETRKKEK